MSDTSASNQGGTPSEKSSQRVLVRVKRRRSASQPHEALILQKRLKLDSEEKNDAASGNNCQNVFKFVGSLPEADKQNEIHQILERIDQRVSSPRPRRADLKSLTKSSSASAAANTSRKSRQETRFTLIQSKRNIRLQDLVNEDANAAEDKKDSDTFHVVTLQSEDSIACNGVEMVKDYVYDLYYADVNEDDAKLMEDDKIFDWRLSDGLMYDSDEDCPQLDESDDSNAEDHWRNDYPDESDDDDEFYNAYDARRIQDYDNEVASLSGSDQESYRLANYHESSDDEGLVYSRNADDEVAGRHGPAYARFKAQVLRDMEGLKVQDSDSDSELDEDDRVALEDGLD